MADLRDLPWNQFTNNLNPDDLISDNFKFYELMKSEIAQRNNIDNSFPGDEELQSAVYLCRNILQPVRDEFGRFSPNSVYRSQELERVLKEKPANWVSTSQHTKGQACDIEIPGLSTRELVEWVIANFQFDQVILECYNPDNGPNAGWVHVSLVTPGTRANRNEILSYIFDPAIDDYIYIPGIVESI